MSKPVTMNSIAVNSNKQRLWRWKCTHFAKNHAKWRWKTYIFGI